MEVIEHVMVSREQWLVSLDCWEFQVYLSRKIFLDCLESECLYPLFIE